MRRRTFGQPARPIPSVRIDRLARIVGTDNHFGCRTEDRVWSMGPTAPQYRQAGRTSRRTNRSERGAPGQGFTGRLPCVNGLPSQSSVGVSDNGVSRGACRRPHCLPMGFRIEVRGPSRRAAMIDNAGRSRAAGHRIDGGLRLDAACVPNGRWCGSGDPGEAWCRDPRPLS